MFQQIGSHWPLFCANEAKSAFCGHLVTLFESMRLGKLFRKFWTIFPPTYIISSKEANLLAIMLSDVLPPQNPTAYKVHFAKWNKQNEPLDVFIRDKREWQTWQEYWPRRNDFNRPLIFSLARFYLEPDAWLFGGIFKVVALRNNHYEVELTDIAADFVGRLKLRSPYRDRAVRVNMEGRYEEFEVAEILRDVYTGRTFPGYDDIELSFSELEALIQHGRQDWRSPLESIKGIYLITDTSTEKIYVGAAYGQGGVWSRWNNYAQTGHGNNAELRKLVVTKGMKHCRNHFRFALLEHRPSRCSDEVIIEREQFWKRLLLARGKNGLCRN